jgi:hypothetical protein
MDARQPARRKVAPGRGSLPSTEATACEPSPLETLLRQALPDFPAALLARNVYDLDHPKPSTAGLRDVPRPAARHAPPPPAPTNPGGRGPLSWDSGGPSWAGERV